MEGDHVGQKRVGLFELLRAAHAGDRSAHDALLLDLRLPIRRFLRSRFRFDVDPAMWLEDVEQETLLHVHCHLADCRATSDGELVAWVLMVARRAALDILRRPAEFNSMRLHAVLEGLADPDAGDEDSEPSLDVRRLVEAQQFLPELDQELLWRRLVSQESWVEVGASLGLSWTAARRRFQRAQSFLRRLTER
jgi:RNA polymerase sigma factor (sigma-70 family)